MKPSEELIKLARQRYFMEVIDTITHKDLMQLATKIAQLEAKIMLYRKAYEQAVEIAWRRWPGERLFTYVNGGKIRSTNPGYCFLMAGWRKCGISKVGLTILELPNKE